ncbi:DUF2157 domain-containing protein [Nocardia caishijiensis]|uniref:Membrane protein DUF2157 n=1 Tax=Nocardia caishijiensis TaxID=184756 RepID=A0ABQ6YRZ4_9NOCA|nr:DUF2157 domain-containing protein [Nocardia caishijiensis]KAF0848545.1 putative membrane protein DUF2157 [Nocardia caishijiensis]
MVREHRVRVALERLVAGGVISGDQRDAVLRAVEEQDRARRAPAIRVVAEIVAYLGAGLVAAGLGLFLDRAWSDIADSGRVVLLAAVAGCSLGGAVVLAGGRAGVFRRVPLASAVRTRLAAALLLLAAGATSAVVATAFGERGDDAEIAAVLAGLLVAILGYLMVPSLLGMIAVAGFGVATIAELTAETHRALWQGVALMAFGAVWFGLAWARRLVVDWAGFLLGGLIALVGAQSVTLGESLWRPALTVLLGVLCLGAYLLRREPVLVVGGATCVALGVGQVVADNTTGGPAVASIVLAVGAVILTVGLVVLLSGSGPPR